MDFDLTSDQQLLQETLQRFIAREYAFERRAKILASPDGFSAEVWQALAEQGVLAVGLPEAHGGFGGAVETMVVMEQIGRGLLLEPFMSTVVLGGGLLRECGDARQLGELAPRIVAGECRMALAHFEPGERYGLERVQTVARRRGAGFELEGHKSVVIDAGVADLLVVSAREADSGAQSLYLLDPRAAGVECTRYRTQDGRTGADVRLRKAAVDGAARLGAPGAAPGAIERTLGRGIAALCAEAVGAMEALNETTLEYLKTRKQFGQPIGRFQVLQHRMADMFLMATQARSMSLLATGRCEHPDAAVRRHALSSAKAFVGRAARFVGQQAVQLHGGMGISAELGVSHYFKRLTMIDVTFGDAEHHEAVVSDALLGAA